MLNLNNINIPNINIPNVNIPNVNIKDFIIIAATILILDFIAFKLYITAHFSKLIKRVQKSDMTVNFFAAAICYLLITTTFYFFVVKQNLSYSQTALLGFLIYAIYETTNLALLKDWTILTVLIDSIWGGILFFLTAFIFYNYKKFSS